ncbi:hypothetical protein GJ496_000153, partial [Pomphorhynchus laevis]
SRRSITKEKVTFWYIITEAGRWICGIEEKGLVDESEVEMVMNTSIYSDPFWKLVTDIGAALLMSVSLFFWFFFSDYRTEIILFADSLDVNL